MDQLEKDLEPWISQAAANVKMVRFEEYIETRETFSPSKKRIYISAGDAQMRPSVKYKYA